jgi:hypothetical protein
VAGGQSAEDWAVVELGARPLGTSKWWVLVYIDLQVRG